MNRQELIAPFGERFVGALTGVLGNQASVARELSLSKPAVTRIKKGDLGVSLFAFGAGLELLEVNGVETESLIDSYAQLVEARMAGYAGLSKAQRAQISTALESRPFEFICKDPEQEVNLALPSESKTLTIGEEFFTFLSEIFPTMKAASSQIGISDAQISLIKSGKRRLSSFIIEKTLDNLTGKGFDLESLLDLKMRVDSVTISKKRRTGRITSSAKKNMSEGQQIRRLLERGMKKDLEVVI